MSNAVSRADGMGASLDLTHSSVVLMPVEGVWTWVDRMDGDVSSREEILGLLQDAKFPRVNQEPIVPAGRDGDLKSTEAVVLVQDAEPPITIEPTYNIPMVMNEDVTRWVEYFTGNGRKHYQKWLDRLPQYEAMFEGHIEEGNLPKDLVFLAMIESGLNTNAYSHAGAVGLWQFMPRTARGYGLRVDWWVDERRDPQLATKAALTYLAALYTRFDDWYLATAAYNGGPGRVSRAMKRSGKKDFWALAKNRELPSETRNYVPKLLAAMKIGKSPEEYGFTVSHGEEAPRGEDTWVSGTVDLQVLAQCAGVTEEEFRGLNPSLRQWATPSEGVTIHLPVGQKALFDLALAKVPKNQRVTVREHRVQRGETLSGISSKYGISLEAVRRANSLRNANKIYVGMTLMLPISGAPVSATTAVASSSSASTSPSKRTHRVVPGDTLSGIGSSYGVSAEQMMAWNGLAKTTILVGQDLWVSPPPDKSMATYVVVKGDTLSVIASRHQVSMTELQRQNKIASAGSIYVGQKLQVPNVASQWKDHQVRPGDTLYKIASRYQCTVGDLQSWNGLQKTVIHPGQTIRIRN